MIPNRSGIRLVYLFPVTAKGLTVRLTDLLNPELRNVITYYTLQFGQAQVVQDRRREPRVWDAT